MYNHLLKNERFFSSKKISILNLIKEVIDFMNDSQLVALKRENEQLTEKICQLQMTAGSNSVHLTRAQQKITEYRTALLKEKWRNLIIRIINGQNRQSIRLGLTKEILETNSTKNSLKELNAKLLAQLREN